MKDTLHSFLNEGSETTIQFYKFRAVVLTSPLMKECTYTLTYCELKLKRDQSFDLKKLSTIDTTAY